MFKTIETPSGTPNDTRNPGTVAEQEIFRSQTEWNLVLAMIRTTLPHPEAARLSFDLITSLTSSENSSTVSLDNFPGLVTILDDFAAVAGFAAERLQRRGRRAEPLTSAK